jgi:hemoglobin
MSLYEELGGAAAINAAVDLFYSKVLNDTEVSYFFDGLSMDRQKGMMRHFLTFAFGGPNNYTGRGMRVAHQRQRDQGMNEHHFDVIMGHLGATLKELGVPDNKIGEAATIALSVKDDVLGN